MKSWTVLAISAVALGTASPAIQAQDTAPQAPTAQPAPRREINVTRDSAPGWVPSAALEEQVLRRTGEYFSALDDGQYERAYGMMTQLNRSQQPLAQFTQDYQQFHDLAGALVGRAILKLTWTKDPAKAPLPGIYAAIDIASHFKKMDRHCGYVVLYRAPLGGEFEIMRQESNYIDDAQAAQIARDKSPAELDHVWATLAAHCPNYRLPKRSPSP